MSRREFVRLLLLIASGMVSPAKALSRLNEALPRTDFKMPVLFIGHGSPENVLLDNPFTQALKKLGKTLPKPEVVLCVSAHWLTKGTYVNASPTPKQIFDFYGFPDELYQVKYTPEGHPQLADLIYRLSNGKIKLSSEWGIDHGAWTVLIHLFPKGDVPVVQLSIDYRKPLSYHYEIAKMLYELRFRKVLIVGSGNITHNLRRATWHNPNATPPEWSLEFDQWTTKMLENGNHQALINYLKMHKDAKMAHPEPSHWIPIIYASALHDVDKEPITYPYEGFQYGLSMRCVKFG